MAPDRKSSNYQFQRWIRVVRRVNDQGRRSSFGGDLLEFRKPTPTNVPRDWPNTFHFSTWFDVQPTAQKIGYTNRSQPASHTSKESGRMMIRLRSFTENMVGIRTLKWWLGGKRPPSFKCLGCASPIALINLKLQESYTLLDEKPWSFLPKHVHIRATDQAPNILACVKVCSPSLLGRSVIQNFLF